MGAATYIYQGAKFALGAEGSDQEAEAQKRAMGMNALEAERMAREAQEKSFEDERQFRMSFRMQEERNKASVSASGIRLEGSPLEALKSNAILAEKDIINIRQRGHKEREAFIRQSRNFMESGREATRAGLINKGALAFDAIGGGVSSAMAGSGGGSK